MGGTTSASGWLMEAKDYGNGDGDDVKHIKLRGRGLAMEMNGEGSTATNSSFCDHFLCHDFKICD